MPRDLKIERHFRVQTGLLRRHGFFRREHVAKAFDIEGHHVQLSVGEDRWCVSLCNHHHAEQHRIGHGQFETRYNLDLLGLAEEFARRSPHRRKLEWAPK